MDVSRTSSRTWLPSRAEPRADPRHQAETSESGDMSWAKPNRIPIPQSVSSWAPSGTPSRAQNWASEPSRALSWSPSPQLRPKPSPSHEPGCAESRVASSAEPNCEAPSLELSRASRKPSPATSQIEPRPVSRAEKRAMSQAEQRFGVEPSRAPSQAEPGLEPMAGKRCLSGSDQLWWRKNVFHWLPILNVSKNNILAPNRLTM